MAARATLFEHHLQNQGRRRHPSSLSANGVAPTFTDEPAPSTFIGWRESRRGGGMLAVGDSNAVRQTENNDANCDNK